MLLITILNLHSKRSMPHFGKVPNKMRNSIIFATVLLFLAGCAGQPMDAMSRDVWNKETKRVYRDLSEEKILSAAERLFVLWDGEDFTFSYGDSELTASRTWSFFAVVSYVDGTDYWKLKTKKISDNEVEVQVSLAVANSQSSMVIGGASPFMGPAMSGGSQVNTPYIYRLFWSRMDYLLGLSDSWYSCDDWKKIANVDRGALGTACNPMAKDDRPTSEGG